MQGPPNAGPSAISLVREEVRDTRQRQTAPWEKWGAQYDAAQPKKKAPTETLLRTYTVTSKGTSHTHA